MTFSLNGVFPNKSGGSRRVPLHGMPRSGPVFRPGPRCTGSSQFGSGFRELQTFRSFHQNPNRTFYRFKFCKVELCTCMCERTPTLGLPTCICTNCPGRVVVLPWRTTRHEPPDQDQRTSWSSTCWATVSLVWSTPPSLFAGVANKLMVIKGEPDRGGRR